MLAAQVRAADFFLGYRRVALAPHEVLLAVGVPFTRRHEYVREFKQAHRRDDDIAIVNAGMRARMRRTLAGARSKCCSVKILIKLRISYYKSDLHLDISASNCLQQCVERVAQDSDLLTKIAAMKRRTKC